MMMLNLPVSASTIASLCISTLLIVTSCGDKMEKSDDASFNGAKFIFEDYSKQTLETTLHYRKIVFKPKGSTDEKVMISSGSPELDIFPADPAVLKDVAYTIIDTVQLVDSPDPKENPHTLYLDPEVFTTDDYQTIVGFVKDSYANSPEKNKLATWLDADVMGLEEGGVYFTIYAIVHQKITAFEPQYTAPNGKDWLRVRVNNKLHIYKINNDGMATEGDFDYTLRNDTLYYPGYEEKSKVDSLLLYARSNGEVFRTRAKVLIPSNVN